MSQIKVELQEFMGSDKSIAESAWTSSTDYQKKKQRTLDDVKRVVEMLATHKHSVPFESVIFKFWFRLPIAIDRQLMTHRIASHSGMSGRYRTMPDDFMFIPEDIDELLDLFPPGIEDEYNKLCTDANIWYQAKCKEFRASKTEGKITNEEYKRLREFMRGVLPQHNMTERVTVMNLRSFSNFMKLRDKPEAQLEIQELAKKMLIEVKASNVCPIAIEWLEKNNWNL